MEYDVLSTEILMVDCWMIRWRSTRQSREDRLRAGGHVRGEDVVRVPVEVLASPVVAHRGARLRYRLESGLRDKPAPRPAAALQRPVGTWRLRPGQLQRRSALEA